METNNELVNLQYSKHEDRFLFFFDGLSSSPNGLD